LPDTTCTYMRHCELISYVIVDDYRVTAGVQTVEGSAFIVLCIKDLLGCQHITTRTPGALALVEKVCRVIREADELVA
jgi:hypothetical protein